MNSLTTPIPSTLLQQKLAQLVIQLQQQASPTGANQDFATMESVLTEAFKLLSQFYKTLSLILPSFHFRLMLILPQILITTIKISRVSRMI